MRTAADGGIRQLPNGREREYLRATTFFSLFQSHADGFSQPAPFTRSIKDAKDVFLWLVWARECLKRPLGDHSLDKCYVAALERSIQTAVAARAAKQSL